MAGAALEHNMAKFDFNLPINATLIFEESVDNIENIDNVQKENSYNDTNIMRISKDFTQKCKPDKHQQANSSVIIYKDSNKSPYINNNIQESVKNKTDAKTEKQITNGKKTKIQNDNIEETRKTLNNAELQDKITFDQNPLNKEIENDFNNTENCNNHDKDHEPAAIIEGLLKTFSEHLILVIQSYYHYGLNRKPSIPLLDFEIINKLYEQLKLHVFESSYHTLVSILLPQEHNKEFINTFLDNTVALANKQFQKWKCHRRSLEPLFNEMLTWSKERRAYLRKITNNDNSILKQILNKPPQNKLHFERADMPNLNAQNNVDIYSSERTGIDINISADTLQNGTERQNCNNTTEWNGNQSNNSQRGSHNTYPSNTIPPTYEQHMNMNKNYAKHHHHVTPYSKSPPPKSTNLNKPNQKMLYPNQNTMFPCQLNGHRLQNFPYMHPSIQSHQTQPQYHDGLNAPNDIRNDQMPGFDSRVEDEVLYGPIISNVISLKPNGFMRNNGHCYICGKITNTTCSKCNKPYSYCSYLCQELDWRHSRTSCC